MDLLVFQAEKTLSLRNYINGLCLLCYYNFINPSEFFDETVKRVKSNHDSRIMIIRFCFVTTAEKSLKDLSSFIE